MYSKLLGAGLITGLMSATAFAEPPIQPGDTLESLSKAKVVTTVNGQPGSLQDIVASGQVRIVSEANPQVVQPMPTNPQVVQPMPTNPQLDVIPADAPAQVPGHDAPVQAVAPDASEAAPMADPAIQAAPEAGAEQMQAPVQALPEAPSLNEAN
ncbi:hypothetical protein [Acinetobacter indicus]|uniref:hypothetical protein n=1 Tax=Acinetobacter indicus TaxID=756892 RepID=UPI001443CC0D|nr:hypothetical protein [Acinetobacter indicus]